MLKTIPNMDTLPVKLDSNGKLIKSDGTPIVTGAPAPTVNMATTVNENGYIFGTVVLDSYNVSLTITAVKGTIDNVNGSNGSFRYKAPDIIDGANTTDTIKASYKIGSMVSEEKEVTINVIYVPLEADDGIQVVDFSTDEQANDGFDYYN